jgi:predicted HAD superfamily hydrolase
VRKISDPEKDKLIEAQKQVIGILFEVVKRLQANNDLDEEYFHIVASKKTQNEKRLDEILNERQENSKVVSKLLKQLEI